MSIFLFLLVLRVDVNDLLHLLVTAEENTRSVVNVFGHNGEHTLHLAVDGLTTSCERIRLAFEYLQKLW